MTKISTKKRSNGKSAAAALVVAPVTKKRVSLGNTNTHKPRQRTRKNVSHQQTIQARDTLDAEYRDWRTGTISTVQDLQPHDGPTTPTTVPTAGFGSSEQSVQDLAGILSAL